MTSDPTSRRLGLRAGQKFATAADFERARRAPKRHSDAFFLAQCAENGLGRARLGMAVGARAIGNAVQRNRMRRLIRESFRMNRHALPPLDVLVTAKAAARALTGREVSASLDGLWRAIGAAR